MSGEFLGKGDADASRALALGEALTRVGAEIVLRPAVFPDEEDGEVVDSLLPLRLKRLRKDFFSLLPLVGLTRSVMLFAAVAVSS